MKKTSIILVIPLFTIIFVGAVNAQDKDDSNKNETKIIKQEYDQNIIIKKKPRPMGAGFCSQDSGVARLRVTFDKFEKITDVEIVSSSGCENFDANSVKAARKIKFKPAIKDGEPITITKLVEFTFTYKINE